MSTSERHMHRCANACMNLYRPHLLRNTNAETAPYIQDALVAKVYTSAMAALVQAGACQVSAHMGPSLAHATHRLVVKPASLVTPQAKTTCPRVEIQQRMPTCPRPRYTPLPCNVYTHVCCCTMDDDVGQQIPVHGMPSMKIQQRMLICSRPRYTPARGIPASCR